MDARPARDSPGDAREDLFDAFRAALDEFETTWEIVSGGWEERWERIGTIATRQAGQRRASRPTSGTAE